MHQHWSNSQNHTTHTSSIVYCWITFIFYFYCYFTILYLQLKFAYIQSYLFTYHESILSHNCHSSFFIQNETRAHFAESKKVPQGCFYSTIRVHFVQNKPDSLLITFQEKPLLCFGCETVKSVSPVSLVEHVKIFIFH